MRHTIPLGPLLVLSESRAEAIDRILGQLGHGRCVAFANTNLLYYALKSPALAQQLQTFTVLNDGVGANLLARLTNGRGFAANLNGTDLVPDLLRRAPSGTRLFLYGGQATACAGAAARLAADHVHLDIVGAIDGYASAAPVVRAALLAAAPDIVLVALGNPLQEQWIAQHAALQPKAVFIGVGALFDFLSHERTRAPALVRALRLEWLFRLAREPARLWRRYTVEAGFVAVALLAQRLRRSPA